MKTAQILFTDIGKAELVEKEIGEIAEDEVLIRNDYTVLSAGTEKAFRSCSAIPGAGMCCAPGSG